LGLQREHVSADCRSIIIKQRIYRGDIDTPKTTMSRWMSLVGGRKEAWVFASENPDTPMWRDNIWRREMKPKLDLVGLGWAGFQELRRTHVSLGHDAGVDPKVAADQRGHGIGVALDVYTKAAIGKRAEAAEKLENSVFAA
jgi:hypothetical protein